MHLSPFDNTAVLHVCEERDTLMMNLHDVIPAFYLGVFYLSEAGYMERPQVPRGVILQASS